MKNLNSFTFTIVILFSALLLIGIGYNVFSSQGYFSLDAQSAALNNIDEISEIKNPSDALIHSYKKVTGSNIPISYNLDVDNMVKDDLRKQIILSWTLTGKEYTQEDLDLLNRTVNYTNETVAKAVALILSAINDATILVEESVANLTAEERRIISELENKTNLTLDEIALKTSIVSRVNPVGQIKGSLYVTDALSKAIPILETHSVIPDLNPMDYVNYPIGSGCAVVGDVYFYDPLCTVVIGGIGKTDYFPDWSDYGWHYSWGCCSYGGSLNKAAFVLDLGGNDYYHGSLALGTSWINPVSVFLDLSGEDSYSAYYGRGQTTGTPQMGGCWQGCWGVGRWNSIYGPGIGIAYDLTGNDVYMCYEQCLGWSEDLAIGIFADFGGTDKIYCEQSCQARSRLFSVSIFHKEGDADIQCLRFENLVWQSVECQAYADRESISYFIAVNGDNNYVCDDFCQAFQSSLGYSYFIDHSGNDAYKCGSYCQAYSPYGGRICFDELGLSDVDNNCISTNWNSILIDYDGIYVKSCGSNCGYITSESGDTGETDIGAPCTSVTQNSQGGFHYKLGVPGVVANVPINCVEGDANALPIVVHNVPFAPVVQSGGQVYAVFCSVRIDQDNINKLLSGSVSIDNYRYNCQSTPLANLAVSSLYFYDKFERICSGCNIAGTQGAEPETQVSYSYSGDWAASALNAISVQSARSKSISSGTSTMILNVNLPTIQGSPLYALSFDYKVHASPTSTLTVNLIRSDGTKVPCFVAPGESTGAILRFDSTTFPINPCTKMLAGTNIVEFVYSKGLGTTNPEAAFIDNLQVNLRPV